LFHFTPGDNQNVFSIRRFLLIGVLTLLASSILNAGPSGYHVTKTVKLGGEGGGISNRRCESPARLYSRGTHVMVVDADTGALLGDIPNTNGVHGIAIAADLDKGFISDGRDSNVMIFDLKTLKVWEMPRRQES